MDKGNEEYKTNEDVRLALLCLRLRARAMHVGNGLFAPPVSEEQLRQTEERLGFDLPPLLRRLYTTVGNGAEFFAPSETFYGIGGTLSRRAGVLGTIESFQGKGDRLDEATVAALQGHPGTYVACDEIPKGFIVLSELGDVSIWLDGPTGRLFASDNVNGQDGVVKVGVSFWASSVEEWIERDLMADPFHGDATRQPLVPLASLAIESVSNNPSHTATWSEPQNSEQSEEYGQPKYKGIPDHVRTLLEQKRVMRETKRLRLQRESQRLRLVRQEVVRLLYKVADVQYSTAEELDKTRLVEQEWGNAPLQSLADAEAQLYEMERILESGTLG